MLSVRVSSLWLLGSSSPGVHQLGLKWTNTPPSSGKVWVEPHLCSTICLHGVYRDNFTLPQGFLLYKGDLSLFKQFICMTSLFDLCLQLNVFIYLDLWLEVFQMQWVLIWLLAWRLVFFLWFSSVFQGKSWVIALKCATAAYFHIL